MYLQACCCSSSSAICPTSPRSRSPTQSRPASAGAVRGRPSLSHPSNLESTETNKKETSIRLENTTHKKKENSSVRGRSCDMGDQSKDKICRNSECEQRSRFFFFFLSSESDCSSSSSSAEVPAGADSPAGSLMFTVKPSLRGLEPPTEAAG